MEEATQNGPDPGPSSIITESFEEPNLIQTGFGHPETCDSILSNLRIVGLLADIRKISLSSSEASTSSCIQQPSTSSTQTTNSNVCCICLDDPRDSAFMTCGHYCICKNCAEIFKRRGDLTCPVCRQVNQEIRTFYDC
jgi:hypothetical protein